MTDSESTAPFLSSTSGPVAAGVRLVVEESPESDARLALVATGQRFRVGRADGQDLMLSDSGVSRRHCLIVFDGSEAVLRDLGSANGTFVNDKPVQGSVKLQTGDVIRVARARIAVVLVTSTQPAVPSGASTHDDSQGVVAADPSSAAMFQLIERLARSDLPVLLHGETGCGKEVVARALHRGSSRVNGPFVVLDCATLVDAEGESELLGKERADGSDGRARKLGVFESAHTGTLFLDEVGELSADNQARLLRALQDRLGSRAPNAHAAAFDVRVVSASHKDLLGEIMARRFRQDLYFRLNGATVVIPPLRSRPGDIGPMVQRFLSEMGRTITLGPGVLATLSSYSWPGNVRELRHAVESAALLCDGDVMQIGHLPLGVRGERPNAAPTEPVLDPQASLRGKVDAIERSTIVAALESTRWNQSRAAQKLKISRRALIYKMERHGLKARPESK